MVEKFKEYLTHSNMAKNTVSAYIYAVNDFNSRHKELTKKNLLLYKTYLIETFKPKTVNLRIQALNKYLEYLRKPRLRLKSVKVQQRTYLENVISNADYIFLKNKLKKEDNQEWYFVVRFLAATGARVSELVQLKVEHVNVGYYDIYTKGGKIRRLFIPKKLRDEAQVWLSTNKREFVPQSIWGADNHTWHSAAVEELCSEVRLKSESGLSTFIPASIRQELPRKVQRHIPACRPDGA